MTTHQIDGIRIINEDIYTVVKIPTSELEKAIKNMKDDTVTTAEKKESSNEQKSASTVASSRVYSPALGVTRGGRKKNSRRKTNKKKSNRLE